MKKRSVILILLTTLIIFTLVITSCAPPAAEEPATEEPAEEEPMEEEPMEEEPMGGGTLYVGVSYDTPNLDNLTTGTVPSAMLLIFDTLVTKGFDGNWYGLVAESWEVSDDNLEWTFHIRDDITYHDGTALTAETVKWFFDKARDPEGQHAFSGSYAPVDEIIAADDYTLVFKLNNPWPNILFTVGNEFSALISPAAYEKYGEEYGAIYAVGSGPFILEEWIPQEVMTVVRNPDYNWGPEYLDNQGPPYLDKIVFKHFPEATTRVAELTTGGIDMLFEVPVADLDQIIGSGDYQIYTAPAWGGALFYLDMNQTKPPLDDLKVRQAFNWALDVEVLSRLTLGEYGSPAYGYMAEHWNCGLEDPKSIAYGYDPQVALDLLAEAGWTDSNDDGIVDKDGEELQFTMWIYNDAETQSFGEVMQSQLAEAGIGVELLQLEYGSMVDGFNANENTLTLLNYGWPDSDVYNLFFYSDQIPYLNSSHIDDPKMDELLDKANTAPTAEERCAGFAEVEQYAIEQAVWAPIYWLTSVIAVNNKVEGILISPHVNNYSEITLAE